MKKSSFLLVLCFFLTACVNDEYTFSFDQPFVEGYKPVYYQDFDQEVSLKTPQPIEQAGKIYVYENLLLVNEVGSGVHVFDNTDKLNPQKKYFLSIPGNRDVAVKNGILYADSFTSLLAINISADSAIVLKEIENVTADVDQFPPNRNSYFECIDESKGKILRWDYVTLENPQCYRP